MKHSRKLKAALMAAASISAAGAVHAAHAAPSHHYTPAAIEQAYVAPDHGDADKAAPSQVKRLGLWAAAAGVLGALVHLVGFKNIARAARAAGPAVARAAVATAKAPVAAVRYIAKSASAPVRFGLAMASLALVAFTGIGLFDVEWVGGMIIGGVLTAMAWYGAARVRGALSPVRLRADAGNLSDCGDR
ncbi:MAG: hypothetical protein R3C40_10595 [Parvularculaceae bacterium]